VLWLQVVSAEVAEWTDEQIGRRDFVEALFHEHAPSLVRLARLFTDDRTGAEDIVQEAFIRLYRTADRIRDRGRAPAYLRSIVLNLARDHNRRGLLSLRHQDALDDRSPPPVPDDEVVRNEHEAAVLDALRALSARQRDCLVLRFYLELSEREIAETLSISPNSVKTHCRRGMANLATVLEAV
jgi:RNA polymerase sigma-70 factor (sigma-E family)